MGTAEVLSGASGWTTFDPQLRARATVADDTSSAATRKIVLVRPMCELPDIVEHGRPIAVDQQPQLLRMAPATASELGMTRLVSRIANF
jgi:hypothetical protein